MRLSFSERELDVMTVLWDRGPSAVAEVRLGLAARGIGVSHNTVLTILRILEDKGRVAREPAGRAHVYRALVDRDAAGASALARLTDTIFGGSAARLAAHLARDPRLTHDEVRRLRAVLDARLGEGVDAGAAGPGPDDAPDDAAGGRRGGGDA
jgi:predicted transcriptional regulator